VIDSTTSADANQSPRSAFSYGTEETTMKPKVTWIVLADGDQAKVFENGGPGKGLTPVDDASLQQEHLKARDIMADKPGRAGNTQGPGSRSGIEYHTDPVEVRERRFVERVAEVLEGKLAEGRYDRLVIAAAPNALGDLRPALSDAVRKTILAELPKDLTNIPIPKLAGHFDGLIAI
jgi:protein required for attachment to host cells